MSDNFDLKKYLVENKATANSKMLNEADFKVQRVNKVVFPNGLSFRKGEEDMEGGKVIFIEKFPKGYAVSGQEFDWDNQLPGEEAYTYYYDLQGNESTEDEIVPDGYFKTDSDMAEIKKKHSKSMKESTAGKSPMNDPRTKQVIQMLKDMDVDGETMEYILRQVGMDDQMASQLVRNKMSETKKKHSKMMKENTGNFFIDFKSEFANYIQDYIEGGADEEVNVVDTNMGIDEWYQYPKTSVLVNHAVKSLKAAGVDSIEKLYAKNNLKYAGESLDEFFQNLKVNETYRGVDFTLIPGVDFSFTEEV